MRPFGRNYIEACELLEKVFPFMGVRFISVNDGYDSELEGGHSEALILSLKNLVNDQYVREISRKVSTSLKVRRERGEHCGAFAPFGYVKSKTVKNKLEPDEETAPIVRDIFRWRAEGMGQSAICKRLDEMGVPCPSRLLMQRYNLKKDGYYKASVWQPKAIKRMIASRLYLGHLEQGKTRQALYEYKPLRQVPESEWHITENAHDPIVSVELWEAANDVSRENRAKYHDGLTYPNLPENLFKGFLVCGACGSKLARHHNKRTNPSGKQYEYFYYACSISRQHPERQFPMVRFENIYDAVLPAVAQRLALVENMGALIEKRAKSKENPHALLDAEIGRVTRELEDFSQKIAGLYEKYVVKDLSEREYCLIKDEYAARQNVLRDRIDALSRRAAVLTENANVDNRWLSATRAFVNPTELTREMLEAMVESIEVSGPTNIHVTWKFRDDFILLEACTKEEGRLYE
jgi:DNA invertase Pin-like site-specific DNA recombinase